MNDYLDPPADDEIDIDLRPAGEVAYRITCLATIVRRNLIEIAAYGGDGELLIDDDDADETEEEVEEYGDETEQEVEAYAAETDRFDLASWALKSLGDHLDDDEAYILRSPIRELRERHEDLCEVAPLSADTLLWALGVRDTLDVTRDVDPTVQDALLAWAPKPWDDVARFARRQALRDEETIALALQQAELWVWRMRMNEADLESTERDRIVAEVAREAETVGMLPTLDDDFEYDGRPVRSLDPATLGELAYIAEMRLHSLAWICGYDVSWENTATFF